MTIFAFSCESEQLDELPSCYYIINLCITVCDHIFEYLTNEVLANERDAQWELEMQLGILHRNLDLLNREIRNEIRLNFNHQVTVLDVHFTRPALCNLLELNEFVTWNSLSLVHPRHLIDFMRLLISESLVSVVPHMPNLSGHRLENIEGYLETALILTKNEIKKSYEKQGFEYPDLFRFRALKARLRIEIQDYREGNIIIFSPEASN